MGTRVYKFWLFYLELMSWNLLYLWCPIITESDSKETIQFTVKLSKVKCLPKRTELNTSSSRRTALELFYYFCAFFLKSSVRSKRFSKLTEYDAFKSWRYWIMLNWSIRFDRTEPNRTELYTKKHKNNQKIRKSSGTVRLDKIELVRLSSVRFENLLKFDSFTVAPLLENLFQKTMN
jgi:hypothetical protein